MKKSLIVAATVMFSLPAFAGGNSNHSTDCGGIGNCNENTTNNNQGGQGGQGGAGGIGMGFGGDAKAYGGSASSKSYSNSHSFSAAGAAAGAISGGNSQAVTVTDSGKMEYSGTYSVKNVPNPPDVIANPTAPCRIAFSGSGSGAGFGIGLGGSVLDEGCNRRENARTLYNFGEHTAALMLMCKDAEVAEVLEACKGNSASQVGSVPEMTQGEKVSYAPNGQAWVKSSDGHWNIVTE